VWSQGLEVRHLDISPLASPPQRGKEPHTALRKALRAPGRVPRGVLEAALNATQPRRPGEVIANRFTGVQDHVFSLKSLVCHFDHA
jgi:hypothetical protein